MRVAQAYDRKGDTVSTLAFVLSGPRLVITQTGDMTAEKLVLMAALDPGWQALTVKPEADR